MLFGKLEKRYSDQKENPRFSQVDALHDLLVNLRYSPRYKVFHQRHTQWLQGFKLSRIHRVTHEL